MKRRNTIAMIYDFDGTLSPQPMQEYTVFPQLDIRPKKFWNEVKKENERIKGEEIITYMMLMLKKANDADLRISKKDLGYMAKKIPFFPGIPQFFGRVNNFVSRESNGRVKVRHYIISSGLKEIINKTKVKPFINKVFASEYKYDQYGAPQYPKLVVTDTVKTQFLFRINKGKEKISESINEYMDELERPIPFHNMVYIGDGMTDVPCMTVTTSKGGYAIAVHKPRKKKDIGVCKKLFLNARVDFIAEADYRKDSELSKYVNLVLKSIIQGISFYNAQRKMAAKRNLY